MSSASDKNSKVFNLLSIGQRGVGKTVFLAGSYLEFQSSHIKDKPEKFSLEYQDSQAKENIEGIINYVAKTGNYPPPTMKVSTFDFALKGRNFLGEKNICNFRWWDIPGESCSIDRPEFQKIVLDSHSCCIFINAYELLNDPNYLNKLEEFLKQAFAIASLVNQHGMQYAFAIILTQCDRLEQQALGRIKLEEKLQPIVSRLDTAKVKYKQFYCSIPVIKEDNSYRLQPSGASMPLLWLGLELNRIHRNQQDINLETALDGNITIDRPKSSLAKYAPWVGGITALGLLGAVTAFVLLPKSLTQQAQVPNSQIQNYEQVLKQDPNNIDALTNLSSLYLENEQLDRALPLMEKIVQKQPNNIDWQINLAKLYELKNEKQKAEAIYDKIIAKQSNNLTALLYKALLHSEEGDKKTAKELFDRAEKVAPNNELKAKVRAIAQNAL